MNRQIQPEAFFDTLSIAHKLDNILDGFERNEIHLFAYFSAILFHYVGNPVDEWKYKFVISKERYPHSIILSDAIDRNLQNGYYTEEDNFMLLTSRGTDEFNKFSAFSLNKIREKFIDAACSTSFLIPYKETKKALLNDPNLIKMSKTGNQDWVSFNNEKLNEITTALGAPSDELIIPAVSWIDHLLSSTKIEG